jgi:hypothetical protein
VPSWPIPASLQAKRLGDQGSSSASEQGRPRLRCGAGRRCGQGLCPFRTTGRGRRRPRPSDRYVHALRDRGDRRSNLLAPRRERPEPAVRRSQRCLDASARRVWRRHGRELLRGYKYASAPSWNGHFSREGQAAAFQRICIDLRRAHVGPYFGSDRVPPPHRMWVWATDKEKAEVTLGLSL